MPGNKIPFVNPMAVGDIGIFQIGGDAGVFLFVAIDAVLLLVALRAEHFVAFGGRSVFQSKIAGMGEFGKRLQRNFPEIFVAI